MVKTELLYKARADERTGREREFGEIFHLSEAKDGCIVTVQRLVATKKKKDFLVVGNERWPDVDVVLGVVVDEPRGHVAAFAKDGKQQRAISGGLEPLHEKVTDVAIADELAYVACDKKQSFVVRGKTKTGPFENAGGLVFSPDGKHLAWIVIEGGKRGKMGSVAGGKYYVIVDGEKRSPGYEQITVVGFSPDGRLAYVANEGGKSEGIYDASGGDWYAVVDGVKGPRLDHINQVIGLQWSDDSKLAYLATEAKKDIAVFDGRKSAPFKSISGVWWVKGKSVFEADQNSYVVDGVRTEVYGRVQNAIFSPDGKHFAFFADIGKKRHVIRDGVKGPAIGLDYSMLAFSPDSAHLAVMIRDGDKTFVQLDERRLEGDYDHICYDLAFSPDSKRFAYMAMKNHEFVWVVDSQVGPAAPELLEGFAFSDDSAHYAYVHPVGKGKKKGVAIVLDGKVTETFDDVRCLAWAKHDGCFVAMAVRGNERLLVRVHA